MNLIGNHRGDKEDLGGTLNVLRLLGICYVQLNITMLAFVLLCFSVVSDFDGMSIVHL